MKNNPDVSNSAPANEIPGILMENGNDLGNIRIHENVVRSIVRNVTLAVNGVTRLAGSTFVDSIAEMVGSRRMHDRSISIHIQGQEATVDVKINVLYGEHVPTVAANIQSAIKSEVEKLTGMQITKVNVIIQELEHPEPEEPEEEEPEEQ